MPAAGPTSQLGAGPASASPSALQFRTPVIAIPAEVQQTEPQVQVTEDGTVLVASQFQRMACETGAPRLAGSRACVWRSTDGGATFRRSGGGQNTGGDVHLRRCRPAYCSNTKLAQPEPGTFTSGVGGATILRPTDNGKTWSSTILNGLSPALDRPFLTVLGGTAVLLT